MPDPIPQPDDPPKRWHGPRNATDDDDGAGLQIFGWDVPGRKPPPIPPSSELQQAAQSPHRYPDIPQPPTREQHADDAAFSNAQAAWIQRYGPTIARRNKFSKGRPKPTDAG